MAKSAIVEAITETTWFLTEQAYKLEGMLRKKRPGATAGFAVYVAARVVIRIPGREMEPVSLS